MSVYYGLIDCNNFYASCERVFAPQYQNTPIVVLSNNDGCIIARSNEAKRLNIPMGAPFFKVEKELVAKGVKVFSSNYALYGNLSNRVMQTIKETCPEIEVYSIDEAFIRLNYKSLSELETIATTIRDQVLKWVGIPVTVGIAKTKTLAKVAANYAKKNISLNNKFILTEEKTTTTILKKTDIGDVWGIGRGYRKQLETMGVTSAFDFSNLDLLIVKKKMGIVGYRTCMELKGFPCLDLEFEKPLRKMIMTTRSFGKAITCREEMNEAIVTYTARCAEKLRFEKQLAGTITVFIQTFSYNKNSPQNSCSDTVNLKFKTSDTDQLIKKALEVLDNIYKENYRYKKAGVLLTDLSPLEGIQTDLFQTDSNNNPLWESVDQLNKKHGISKVRFLAEGINKDWKMRSGKRSPHYTTKWNELLVVN